MAAGHQSKSRLTSRFRAPFCGNVAVHFRWRVEVPRGFSGKVVGQRKSRMPLPVLLDDVARELDGLMELCTACIRGEEPPLLHAA